MKRTLAFLLCTVLAVSFCAGIPPAVSCAEEESGMEEQEPEKSGSGDTALEDKETEKSDADENNAKENSDKENAEDAVSDASQADGAQLEISAPSAILMEASTGTVLYEKDSGTARPPASVTKIMTMLLIFDALDSGAIHLDDEVTTSEYAASMGGSQVFLEAGEVQTVDTLLKCISVASANDACVAMAEYICGSEDEFVRRMNERAKELGMENTTFKNCNGLDADGHVTSARDIAVMSQELITRYPQIRDYCMIWMENITHTTNKGTSEFGLTNTNKLVRQYEYATGLKTGSTGEAKFCVSATAEKNGVELIAVIMAADNSKLRFKDAVTLLSYGFGKCQLYEDDMQEEIPDVKVEGGVRDQVSAGYAKRFTYLDTRGANLGSIEKEVELKKPASAPVKKGDVLGRVVYRMDGSEIGSVDIVAEDSVGKAGFTDYFFRAARALMLQKEDT